MICPNCVKQVAEGSPDARKVRQNAMAEAKKLRKKV
jgi:hypothetical protein